MRFLIASAKSIILVTLALLLLAGCASTVDVSHYQKSDICEVHKCAMTIQEVGCIQGNPIYLNNDFLVAMPKCFPHHGRAHYSEGEGHFVVYARQLRIYVCAECTEAYDQWRKKHPTE